MKITNAAQRIKEAQTKGLAYHSEYEMILDALARVRIAKCVAYGEARYIPMDKDMQRWLCYSDVYRKFIRLEQQMKTGSTEDLIETYSDLANYAIMALQLLSRKQ
jgi:hypothetical protein